MTKANDYYVTDIFILCPFFSERQAIKSRFASKWGEKKTKGKKIVSALA